MTLDDMSDTTAPARFNWAPIRKITLAAITALVVYVLQRLGVDLGSDAINDGVQTVLPIVVGYVAKDPRVLTATEFLDQHAAFAEDVEDLVLDALEKARERKSAQGRL